MNMGRLTCFAAGVLALSAAGLAQAQSRDPGWEFGVDVIYQNSQDIDFEGGTNASLDDDFGFSFVFGYRFSDRLELQFALDWQDIDYDASLVVDPAVPGLPSIVPVRGSLETFTPRVNVNYNFMEGPITPYVNAGIGYSFIDTNIPEGRPETVCWWDPWYGYICGNVQNTKTLDEFEYNLGLGVRWDFSPGLTFRAAYEKHWLDMGEATSTPDFDQFKVGIAYRY